jgi:hypothetical protein
VTGVPLAFFVGAVQVRVAEPVVEAVGAVILMVKGASEALLVPLLAEIVIAAELPSSAVPGVPDSSPVVVLKVAQLGFPAIE